MCFVQDFATLCIVGTEVPDATNSIFPQTQIQLCISAHGTQFTEARVVEGLQGCAC